jgi:ribonuclease D
MSRALIVFLVLWQLVLGFTGTRPIAGRRRRLVKLSMRSEESSAEYKLVQDQTEFFYVCRHLEKADALGIDFECEFNRHRYGMHLCLIQVSDGTNIYIVDPLIVDAAPLWNILGDEDTVIIMHGPRSDLVLLDYLYGCRPRNMFDTEKAAQLLGYPSSSLSFLLERHFGRSKEKKLTAANWNKRPISSEMLDYAALDVAHLHQLKDILMTELDEMGRLSWHDEECLLLEHVRYREKENPHLRLKGADRLNDQEAHVLKYLFEVRDGIAQQFDKPPYQVIMNPILLKLAKQAPESQEAWSNLKGVHPRVRRNAQHFHRAVLKAHKTTPEPALQVLPDYYGFSKDAYSKLVDKRIEVMDSIRNQIQQEYHDIPGLVFSPRTVRRIATGEACLGDLREWQRAIVNQTAQELELDMALLLL